MILVSQVNALVRRRQVLATLVQRDLRVRYARSVLGYLWTIIDPLAMACVYFIVFTQILKARDTGYSPYFLYLLTGLLAWQWFSQSMTETSRALLSEARLVRSTNLPRELWVVRVVIAKGVEFVLSLPVLAAFTIYYLVTGQTELHWGLVLFPVGIVLQFLLMVGIGLVLAPVTTLVTDTARVVRIALRMGFYATPVLYSVQAAPEGLRTLLLFNPMTGITEFYRAGLFSGRFDAVAMIVGAVITGVVLLIGVVTFPRLEPAVLKEI
jgi:ABC-type polysaccharide/polyol phosphate export permease